MTRANEKALKKVAVALDTGEWSEFEEWCSFFGSRVGVLKVGLEAYVRWGPRALEVAGRHAQRLFVDLKLHDIPNTVAGAVRSVAGHGADLVTVHASGGKRMVAAAAEAAGDRVDIVAVTVLTHLDEDELGSLSIAAPIADRVSSWARLAVSAGARAIVCSPLEVARLAEAGLASDASNSSKSEPLLITPGIRMAGAVSDDQRRVTTPADAIRSGAGLLVIGRPLTRAANRDDAMAAIAASIAGAAD